MKTQARSTPISDRLARGNLRGCPEAVSIENIGRSTAKTLLKARKPPNEKACAAETSQRQAEVVSNSVSATATSISGPQPSNLTPAEEFRPPSRR